MNWSDQVVLVTGGSGSFGRKFAQVLLRDYTPKKLIIFSRDELKQHEMQQAGFDDPRLRFFIGDVRDRSRLERAFHGVDIVVHAAALKQIPACEYNPIEAILTNVTGSRNVIDAAIDQGVRRVMLISSDKAVNPVNLYGATKLCAEKLVVHSNTYSGPGGARLSCVRYGNVVGSRGSVIPLFLSLRDNGALPITDERMTRFWLTLDQGVRFVVRCIEQMQGGEVFVPKIPSMSILDLAKAIAPEAKLEMIGIRPGEKLHEVLVSEHEIPQAVELDDMFVIQPPHPWWDGNVWMRLGRPPRKKTAYASDTNTEWLTVEALHRMVESVAQTAPAQP